MHSRTNSTESPTRPKLSQPRAKDHHKGEAGYSGKGNAQTQQKEKDDVARASTILRSPKAEKKQKSSVKKREDLSRDDLLFLLSVLEGELQVMYCPALYSKLKDTPPSTPIIPSTTNICCFYIKKTPYTVWYRTNMNCSIQNHPQISYNSCQTGNMIFVPRGTHKADKS